MVDFPKSKWIHNWGIDQSNANDLHNLISHQKPQIIVETGTFEGQATYVMAQAANLNQNHCIIYTIDYDGDPTTNYDKETWLSLKQIRNNNLEEIRRKFTNVTVHYIEGDSREVLQTMFQDYTINKVDLFYQDSMHFKEGIEAEWKLVEPYLQSSSLVIFDDLCLRGVKQFRDWFKKYYQNQYEYREVTNGHQQFIVIKK